MESCSQFTIESWTDGRRRTSFGVPCLKMPLEYHGYSGEQTSGPSVVHVVILKTRMICRHEMVA